MSENSWIFDLESMIFSRIKYATEKELKSKHPNIVFTTTDKPVDTSTSYPTVYIHEMTGTEAGKDLEGNTINGVYYYMQIEVITNKSQKEAKDVMRTLVEEYKKMRFETTTPYFQNGNNYYRCLVKVNRIIGQSDIL